MQSFDNDQNQISGFGFHNTLNAQQNMELMRLMKACASLDERKLGFHYPDGQYDNMSSILGHSNFFMGHLLYLTQTFSEEARNAFSLSMNMPVLSEEEYENMINSCHQVYEMTKDRIPEVFPALAQLDIEEMEQCADISEYIPYTCLYVDIMETAGGAALNLCADPDLYESIIQQKTEEFTTRLLMWAVEQIPGYLYTKPFIDADDRYFDA